MVTPTATREVVEKRRRTHGAAFVPTVSICGDDVRQAGGAMPENRQHGPRLCGRITIQCPTREQLPILQSVCSTNVPDSYVDFSTKQLTLVRC